MKILKDYWSDLVRGEREGEFHYEIDRKNYILTKETSNKETEEDLLVRWDKLSNVEMYLK